MTRPNLLRLAAYLFVVIVAMVSIAVYEKGQQQKIINRVVRLEKIVEGKPGKQGATGTSKTGIAGKNGRSIRGSTGANGRSIRGSTGATGANGKSIVGPRGARGPEGHQGPRGAPGIPGISPSLAPVENQIQQLESRLNALCALLHRC